MHFRSVGVFCGANPSDDLDIQAAARALGAELGARRVELVYGGGRTGLMGMVADAALAAGGAVFGVIPGFLRTAEIAHDGLSELHVVESMHERKALMAARAEAFVALPGGFGTLDELFEILTWRQLFLHQKPVFLYNQNGFFDLLLAFLDTAVERKLLRPDHRAFVRVVKRPSEIFSSAE
jgi:hypothetical protein